MSEELKQTGEELEHSTPSPDSKQMSISPGDLNHFPTLSNILGEAMATATPEGKVELAREVIKAQHDAVEREKDREHEALENAKNREHATLEKEKERAHAKEENEMKRMYHETEKQADREYAAEEKAKDREHEAAEGRKTRVSDWLLKYAPALLLLVALVVFAVVRLSSTVVTNVVDDIVNVEVPDSSKNYEGKPYQDVKTSLEDAGFTNVQEDVKADLNSGFLDGLTSKLPGKLWNKDGAVERVSINGRTSFNKGDTFPKNATIRITYHTYSVSADNEE